jgi:hypothetical protein
MIVDLIVPVQPESNRPPWPAEGYAISLASLFGAHVTGIVPSFGHAISGMVRAEIPAELIEEFQRRSDEAARTALTAFQKRAYDAEVMHQDLALRCGPAEFADALNC